MNFWATWCGPCIEELPEIQVLEQGNDEVAVISVNRRESLDDAEGFLADLPNAEGGEGVSFTVDGIDPDDTLYDTYRGLGMPVSYFIDPRRRDQQPLQRPDLAGGHGGRRG